MQKQLSCTLGLLGLKTLLTFLGKLFMHAGKPRPKEEASINFATNYNIQTLMMFRRSHTRAAYTVENDD